MSPPVVCACDDKVRSACYGTPSYEHKHRRYCLFHLPSERKIKEFNEALEKKRLSNDYSFRGVWFPEPLHFIDKRAFKTKLDFSYATFNEGVYFIEAEFGAEADFSHAVFNVGAYFYRSAFRLMPNFRNAKFQTEANFAEVHFNDGADFRYAVFSQKAVFGKAEFRAQAATFETAKFEAEANFDSAVFDSNVSFQEAVFHAEANFIKTTFAVNASFKKTTFRDYVRFEGTEDREMFRQITMAPKTLRVPPSLDLQSAKIENPQRVYFDSLILRPHWFVKASVRDLNFSNVKWDWRDTRSEIRNLKRSGVTTPREALGTTCRQLADNADDDRLYEDASMFRFMSMEARRLETWRGFAPWKLSWWYWLASGYGERVWQAFAVLAGIWLLSASLYMRMDFAHWGRGSTVESQASTLNRTPIETTWAQALLYSLGVMTLQRPEPRPTTSTAQSLVMLETIFGPIQAGLLALAIRRKFMR